MLRAGTRKPAFSPHSGATFNSLAADALSTARTVQFSLIDC